MNFTIQVANEQHLKYAEEIATEMEESAKVRGTGIAKRSPEYLQRKMDEGKAIIALNDNREFAGFCYIETWSHGKFVANSGLIVNPKFREHGLAKKIKEKAFELSKLKYPGAKLFGLTTSLAVMKINSDLGYKPVTLSELTDDEEFWKGCQSCVNYDILVRTKRAHCLCTGMLHRQGDIKPPAGKKSVIRKNIKLYQRWLRMKQTILLKKFSTPLRGENKTLDRRKVNSI